MRPQRRSLEVISLESRGQNARAATEIFPVGDAFTLPYLPATMQIVVIYPLVLSFKANQANE